MWSRPAAVRYPWPNMSIFIAYNVTYACMLSLSVAVVVLLSLRDICQYMGSDSIPRHLLPHSCLADSKRYHCKYQSSSIRIDPKLQRGHIASKAHFAPRPNTNRPMFPVSLCGLSVHTRSLWDIYTHTPMYKHMYFFVFICLCISARVRI